MKKNNNNKIIIIIQRQVLKTPANMIKQTKNWMANVGDQNPVNWIITLAPFSSLAPFMKTYRGLRGFVIPTSFLLSQPFLYFLFPIILDRLFKTPSKENNKDWFWKSQ